MPHYYTCSPVDPESLEGKKFIASAWCGEGYDTKRDAIFHKKFFEKTFNCKFVIEKDA